MITEDQSEVVRFLESPSTHGGARVERVDTHASIVFLAGDRAWKLKRAVRYDYLDFSTADRRRQMADAEVRVNRRTAPDLYLGVVPVTRDQTGALALGGDGAPVDWLVEMRRFDQQWLFDRLAARGALDLTLMRPLASAVASLHRVAEPRRDHGGRTGMAWVVDGNDAGFAREGAAVLDAGACRRVTDAARRELDRHGQLLDARRDTGRVRQCHGDLHLRNIVLLDGRPTLFDAIEFNDEIACTDVLYDLAFLLMDLWHRGLRDHANMLWNAYLSETAPHEGAPYERDECSAGLYGPPDDGLPLMPLFLSCRAAVRAKTGATAASMQADPAARRALEDEARAYLDMADQLLRPPPAYVLAVGGFSGSGKTTLARALAPALGAAPGAVVVRSDEVRKRLCGVEPLVRLGADGYTTAVSRRVYRAVVAQAAGIAREGIVAIADAVFAREADRVALESAAAAAGVPFVGLWLDAPESVLLARTADRRMDASDADAAVVKSQLAQETGVIRWVRIDAAGDVEDVLTRARAGLERALKATDPQGRARIAS